MIYIGVDLGGTNIAVGLVDEEGKILLKGSTPTLLERGPEPIIQDMGKLALELLEKGGYTIDDVASIGVGVPGVTNPETGVISFCTNLRWHNVPLTEILSKIIDKPIYIENDATVAALAESVAGVSKGLKNSIFLTLGTGVGGGIIIDGKIYAGTHHVGSELGHMTINVEGIRCTCGNVGCWEQSSSATALIRMGRRGKPRLPHRQAGGRRSVQDRGQDRHRRGPREGSRCRKGLCQVYLLPGHGHRGPDQRLRPRALRPGRRRIQGRRLPARAPARGGQEVHLL